MKHIGHPGLVSLLLLLDKEEKVILWEMLDKELFFDCWNIIDDRLIGDRILRSNTFSEKKLAHFSHKK